ncbi:hypothetical protein [Pseudomonas citrulli]|uniref:Delta-60 repeat domain-containing protein n=1 Tax=Pseudomonas citrulli TaxID=3064347 RepID=A0ABT9C490_9PSED|nr:hypothetical protein [Pseudomonas sp. K18]MDO7899019.1 hypothetical protein [Pseudomonas sp. K18]
MNAKSGSTPAAAGSLDRDFGNAGKVGISFPGSVLRGTAVPQPDGTILSVGTVLRDQLVLARLLSDGAPDGSFGNEGMMQIPLVPGSGILDTLFASQDDGKIIVLGTLEGPPEWVLVFVRLLPDGRLDSTFGAGGMAFVNVLGGDDEAHAVAIQPDGKIIATSRVIYDFNVYKAVVLRLTATGALDPAFGLGGIVLTQRQAFHCTRVQQDGSILVGGSDPSEMPMIARFHRDGKLDPGFGVGGYATIAVETAWRGQIDGLALQPDGKIVAAGRADFDVKGTRSLVTRLDPQGRPDPSFNEGRPQVTGIGETGAAISTSVVVQSDGKIVVSGYKEGSITLIRYLADGQLDVDFGESGRVITDFAEGGVVMSSRVGLQADGKIVVSGHAIGGIHGIGIARYLP